MNRTFKQSHILAKNIEYGAKVSIYGEDWICCGLFNIHDGGSVIERILLCSYRDSSFITFVNPKHEFIFDFGHYLDSNNLLF